jgi:hypothetical protein
VKLRLAVVTSIVGVLALSGCDSEMHPGSAAIINGTAITQDKVDDVALAACNYLDVANKSAAQPQPALSLADVRLRVLNSFVIYEVVGAVTHELGLTINPADVNKAGGAPNLPDGLSADDEKLMNEFFYDGTEEQIAEATIGAHLKDPSVTDSTGVTPDSASDAADYITDKLNSADVDVNPTYGTWDGTSVALASGSLSDPVSDTKDLADASTLPDAQTCG